MRSYSVNKGRTCKAQGCDREAKCKELCIKHYHRQKTTGDPLGKRKSGRPVRGYVECQMDGCKGNARTKGLCETHYQRLLKHGDPLAGGTFQGNVPDVCEVKGCESPAVAQNWCGKHYARWQKHGDPEATSDWYKKRFEPQVDEKGYVWIYKPDHPNAWKGGRVAEHRLVMSDIIGRPLKRHENVHHINGNRGDNRPENLELWVSMQPTGQRVDELVSWAREIVTEYGDLVDRMQ